MMKCYSTLHGIPDLGTTVPAVFNVLGRYCTVRGIQVTGQFCLVDDVACYGAWCGVIANIQLVGLVTHDVRTCRRNCPEHETS